MRDAVPIVPHATALPHPLKVLGPQTALVVGLPDCVATTTRNQQGKFMRTRIVMLALVVIGNMSFPAWSDEPSKTRFHCTSKPCGNTATGEDPQDILLRDARAEQNKIKDQGTDQARWQIPIYSTSTKTSDLEMYIDKNARFLMRLAPAQGYVYFSKPSANQSFKIDEPNTPDNPCPKYNLQVVDGSAQHAVIQKSCPRIQYKPGKFISSVTYYLYDASTGTMRNIWQASAVGSKDPLPLAEPAPSMKVVSNGYLFDWKGLHPGGSSTSPSVINNKYVRKTENNKPVLVCIDMKLQGGAVEDEMCEGESLPRVN